MGNSLKDSTSSTALWFSSAQKFPRFPDHVYLRPLSEAEIIDLISEHGPNKCKFAIADETGEVIAVASSIKYAKEYANVHKKDLQILH